jgi:SOS response regulatory protein OraA/RecX
MAERRRESFGDRRARRATVDDPAVVLEAAIRYLEARSRSEAEVRRRLTGAGYRGDLVDGAVARLLDLGVLDDDAFARAWVGSRDRARPRGERALRAELRQKGIAAQLIESVLEERRDIRHDLADAGRSDAPPDGATSTPDVAAAERLLARHRRAFARIDDPRQRRQRAYALLARNGFDPEIASSLAARIAVDAVEDGNPDDDPVA